MLLIGETMATKANSQTVKIRKINHNLPTCEDIVPHGTNGSFILDFRNVSGKQAKSHTKHFKTERHTPQTFLKRIKAGWQYTNAHYKRFPATMTDTDFIDGRRRNVKTPRIKENFAGSRVISLDDDSAKPVIVDYWTKGEPSNYLYAFVESATSRPGKEKGHPVIILNADITNIQDYEELLRAINYAYPQLDQSINSCNRITYNKRGATIHEVGNIVTYAQLFQRFVLPYREHLQRQEMAFNAIQGKRVVHGTQNNENQLQASNRLAAYQQAAYKRIIDELGQTLAGRNQALLKASTQIGRFLITEWADKNLWLNAETDIIKACLQNGYIPKYGNEQEVLRIFNIGRNNAYQPVPRPIDKYPALANPREGVPTMGSPSTVANSATECHKNALYAPHFQGWHNEQPITITMQPGQYLGDVMPDTLPARCLINAQTGMGKTTWISKLQEPFVYVCAGKIALEQFIANRRKLGLSIDAYYQHEKTANEYSSYIVTTYESLPKVLKYINIQNFSLIVDEFHNLAVSSSRSYRYKSLRKLLDIIFYEWQAIRLLSGTHLRVFHGGFRGFTLVNCKSQIRHQQAVRIGWDGDKMTKFDAWATNFNASQTSITYLNNKGQQLDKYKAMAIAKGAKANEIACINADERNSEAAQMVINHETLPARVKHVFVTSAINESISIKRHFDVIHIVSPVSPAVGQQLVNRLRGDAMANLVYWYTNGTGKGYQFDSETLANEWTLWAYKRAKCRNKVAKYDPNTQEGMRANMELKAFAGDVDNWIQIRADEANNEKYYDVDFLSISHSVYNDEASYAHNNPIYFKGKTRLYGWLWDDDIHLRQSAIKPKTKQQVEMIATLSQEERQAAIVEMVDTIANNGYEPCLQNVLDSETPNDLRTLSQHVLNIVDELGQQESGPAFNTACELVKEVGTSKRKEWATRLKIRVQYWKLTKQELTTSVYDTFRVGERYTADEIHAKMWELFDNHNMLEDVARNGKLTKTRSTQLFKLFFGTKRGKLKVRNVNCHIILNDDPLSISGLISHFYEQNNNIDNESEKFNKKTTFQPIQASQKPSKESEKPEIAYMPALFDMPKTPNKRYLL